MTDYSDEFGCFTGDCPHDDMMSCIKAIIVEYNSVRTELDEASAQISTYRNELETSCRYDEDGGIEKIEPGEPERQRYEGFKKALDISGPKALEKLVERVRAATLNECAEIARVLAPAIAWDFAIEAEKLKKEAPCSDT